LRRVIAACVVLIALAVAVALARTAGRRRGGEADARCGPGFVSQGALCAAPTDRCPLPLERTEHGCDAPDTRVLIPASSVAVGPEDWEAAGRVLPRSIRVQAFRIDAFEATRGRWGTSGASGPDSPRAASGMTRAQAQAYCESRGGRLPTEDEWIVAAVSGTSTARRYPWGDTGAVCRRAAWGLLNGPCATGSDGPDSVGAHPDGDSPLGLHDVAGNVAEWVGPETGAADAGIGIAKGGSWVDALATELRVWARLELAPERGDRRVGVRCAYPP
jgi:formylglycine-generating enzyme required for sulfatase activity